MNTGVANPSYRQRLGYHSMVLGGICGIVATLILLGNLSTHEQIAKELRQDQIDTLAQVIPQDRYDNDILNDTLTLTQSNQDTTLFVARKGDAVVGVAIPIVGYGYSGAINLIMGIDNQGKIIAVRVINHAETPGLGDKIEINKDTWITGFNGHSLASKSANQWQVKKDGGDFDQFTGATITPRAVVGAVYNGLTLFENNRSRILSPPIENRATKSQPPVE